MYSNQSDSMNKKVDYEEVKDKLDQLHEQGLIKESLEERLDKLDLIKKEYAHWEKDPELKQLLRLFKALANKNRLLILKLIMKGISCPCEIEHIAGLSQSTISHHLNLLVNAKAIRMEKSGKWSVLETEYEEFDANFFKAIIQKHLEN